MVPTSSVEETLVDPQSLEFYKDAASVHNLKIKKYFEEKWGNWKVYIMKTNKGKDRAGNAFSPSIINLSALDLKETTDKLIALCNEIAISPEDGAEPEIMTRSMQIGVEDHHDPGYWDDEITKKVSSGNFWFRPAYNSNGKVVIRFLSPRPQNETYTKQWLGVSIYLPLEVIITFVKVLQKFEKEIREDEKAKFKALMRSMVF